MNSGKSDGIVIKRKRRRRTAVDPCLGYYAHNEDDLFGSPSQIIEREEKKEKDVGTNTTEPGKTQRKDAMSSDSAPMVTSPLSENTNLISVDDFLRQQVQHVSTMGSKRCRATYSRKRQRRTMFSSDDDDSEHDENQYVAAAQISSPQLRSPPKRRGRPRAARRMSTSQRRATSKAEVTFSAHIQRAALLSSVEPDSISLTIDAPLPLKLVPRGQLSPATPPQDQRAKRINPRVPRRLDTSFANKDCGSPSRSKTKTYRPFFQWNCPPRNFNGSLPASAPSTTAMKDLNCRRSNSIATPLKLVPYDEHSEARAAKFDLKPRCKGQRLAEPLSLQQSDRVHVSIASTTENVNDPFESSPLSSSSQPKVCRQPESKLGQQDDNISIRQDTTPSPVPQPFQSPMLSYSIAVALSTDRADQDRPLETCPKPPAEYLDVCAADATGPSRTFARSSPPPAHSQKPLRRLGTMLDGFRERARSILLSQSQAQAVEDSTAAGPRPSELQRIGSGRLSSRRVVVSSPARIPTPAPNLNHSADGDGRTFVSDPLEGPKSKKARRSKSVSLPSVSAFLRRHTIMDSSEGSSSDLNQSAHYALHHSAFRKSVTDQTTSFDDQMGFFVVDDDSAEVFSGLHSSNFFSNYNSSFAPPSLFDLIEETEPRNDGTGMRIVLSPAV